MELNSEKVSEENVPVPSNPTLSKLQMLQQKKQKLNRKKRKKSKNKSNAPTENEGFSDNYKRKKKSRKKHR